MARLVTLSMLAALAAPAALAQALSDPTRPPGRLDVQAEPAAPLQSVLISADRKSAVIYGKVVPLGGTVGGARLVRIAPDEVTLDDGRSLHVLKLFPAVRKSPSPEEISPRENATTENGK